MRLDARNVAVAFVSVLVLVLGACQAPPPPRPTYPPIAFQDRAPIRLDVGEISVERAYQPPAAAPNVDHLFPVSLIDSALRWPAERLVAAGAGGFRAEFVVHDASATETLLKRATGLTAIVTKEQAERYDARLAVELRIVDSMGRVVGKAEAEAMRRRSVAEDITINDRDRVWYEMTKDLVAEVDRQLDKTVRTVLQPYVLP